MKVLDLFSGIGGFALGLGHAGMTTIAFVENEPYCRRVLKKNFPGVPRFGDIREVTARRVEAVAGRADLICGGFPCQDISTAGKGAGIEGSRSGLWREFARLVRECRPDWVVVENVPALRSRGADVVLADLEEAGYAARPLVVGALHAGAPHRRQRVWIVANAKSVGRSGREQPCANVEHDGCQPAQLCDWTREAAARMEVVADADIERRTEWAGACDVGRRRPESTNGDTVADAECGQLRQHQPGRCCWTNGAGATVAADNGEARYVAVAGQPGLPLTESEELRRERRRDEGRAATERGWWELEPDVGRVAYGVPARVDRLRSLGNAVVPQVAEMIGRAILQAARSS